MFDVAATVIASGVVPGEPTDRRHVRLVRFIGIEPFGQDEHVRPRQRRLERFGEPPHRIEVSCSGDVPELGLNEHEPHRLRLAVGFG